jgi:hypothetical protein
VRLGGVLLGLAFGCASALASCTDDEVGPTELKTCGEGHCTADPSVHLVFPQGCAHSGQCPSGSICVETGSSAGSCRSGDGGSLHESCTKRCRVPGPDSLGFDRSALIRGFGSDSFTLQRVDQGSGSTPDEKVSFTWDRPAAARIVSCALFGCSPEVISEGGSKEFPKLRIANFAQCVIAMDSYPSGAGTFRPVDAQRRTPSGSGCDAALTASSERYVRLTAGCWAVDSTKVIAATPLEPVDPRAVFDDFDPNGVVIDCSDAGARPCMLPRSRIYGTCSEGVCLSRCLEPHDCYMLTPIDAGDAGDAEGGTFETCTQGGECRPLDGLHLGQTVGVCAPTRDHPAAVRGVEEMHP